MSVSTVQWKHAISPGVKKAKISKLQEKGMVITFFNSKGFIHVGWVTEGQGEDEEEREQSRVMVSPGESQMPQVNVGNNLDDQQGNESSTIPTLQC